jgi:hypothetical protein
MVADARDRDGGLDPVPVAGAKEGNGGLDLIYIAFREDDNGLDPTVSCCRCLGGRRPL